ncbi:MAG TPA: LytTR family DNA-binding domain-containing protein, partial [Saprospiraceae bacterium]|nr:LytTR family DNA-binding domain-containing protein [Saprospiraceae bacterium]
TAKSKFLYQVSLKSLQNSLNPQQFVRIHRTTIVNTQSINTLKSRLNGDYDITMSNSEVLRMSRNYYANFRTIFNRMPKSITSS